MQFSRRRRESPSLSITPLIDVVLLLLIFFMLSTTFVAQPGIGVNLPKAKSTEVTSIQDIVLVITADSRLYLDEQSVELDDLRTRLRQTLAQRPGGVLIVKADKSVAHGLVVTAMDLAKQLGIQRIAIATQPLDQEP